MNKNIQTFIACDNSFEDSSVVLFGAPFDGTTSFRPGTRFAPNAIRNESFGIETYSPYCDKDLVDYSFVDIGDIELPFGNTEKVLEEIYNTSKEIVAAKKKFLMIGGEHLVSLGSFKAIYEAYPDVRVVHLDAHTDLRTDYLGEVLSHSTVIRRIHDIVGDGRIFQFGIRSGEKYEFEFAKEHTVLHKFDLNNLKDYIEELSKYPIYFTLDLDVLDPSIFAGTGTPEAGGVSYKELLDAFKCMRGLNVVSADVNELSPHYDQSGVSTAVACKTIREVLLQLLAE